MHARILGLASIFPYSKNLVDIGSDHGYLGLELIRQRKVGKVTNIDLSEDALNRSKIIYEKLGFLDRSTFLVSDGFKELKLVPIDSTVVIAGMGTYQILKILEFLPDTVDKLLILSHTDYFFLRNWAVLNSFSILREFYIDDKDLVYLAIFLVRKNPEAYTLKDLILGKSDFYESQIELFRRYWRTRVSRILKVPEEYRNSLDSKTLEFLSPHG
ncbi:conserved hypothetical protein [Mycoplasma haemofelis str. Langford 1]|uniref:SAM-dependent methyltransferase n=2 Tax=Mycoplasma haemofelis TaxID=29501 RepID=F6FFW5_MYCHI|nr:tRNA (adenine(22)-N(1))-methyltransferase TrmK [Mycoplasma haemofelis]AEG72431.1 hypothetical protein MHF_0129 [Mycoplasma haemofelis Ohio2]CBY92118.1 conserved hypothetical protein [Mycoplasma haemofelis str. Langford 1]